jgi:2OG-Fe(II) oxygenase superfamily
MKCTIESAHFAVFDEVLEPGELRRLNKYTSTEAALEYINTTTYRRVWTLNDGNPLASPTVILDVERGESGAHAARSPDLQGPEYFSYPSDCAIDSVVDRLVSKLALFERWVGRPQEHWRSMTARAFLYPQGTSLDWHEDGDAFTGAFTLYTHLEWRPAWGGELLISAISDLATKPDSGTFVCPRPNRLVIVRGGTPHKICRVSNLAGENIRQAISGFFDKRSVDQAIEAS